MTGEKRKSSELSSDPSGSDSSSDDRYVVHVLFCFNWRYCSTGETFCELPIDPSGKAGPSGTAGPSGLCNQNDTGDVLSQQLSQCSVVDRNREVYNVSEDPENEPAQEMASDSDDEMVLNFSEMDIVNKKAPNTEKAIENVLKR